MSSSSSAAAPSGSAIGKVTTMAPGPWEMRDPFIFCAYHLDTYPAGNEKMGPDPSLLRGRRIGQDFANKDGWNMYHGSDGIPGFPQHPHRGFETITIVRKGVIDHSDSLGSSARFGGGDTQWVTAGRGIVHSEMFPLINKDAPNPLQLFQIWLNLPARSKMVPAHFTMFWNEKQPKKEFTNEQGKVTTVTIVAGELEGQKALPPPPESWASQKDADVAIWLLSLEPGASWTIPPLANKSSKALRTLYFYEGDGVTVDGRVLQGNKGSVSVELKPFESCLVQATSAGSRAELLMLQGAPIGEPVAQHGPFVMNTQQEIAEAFADYRRTQFGGWPFPEDAPAHPREQKRFAKHSAEKIEEPEGK